MLNDRVDKSEFYKVIKLIDSSSKKELAALARVEKAITEVMPRKGRIDPVTGDARPVRGEKTKQSGGGGDFAPVLAPRIPTTVEAPVNVTDTAISTGTPVIDHGLVDVADNNSNDVAEKPERSVSNAVMAVTKQTVSNDDKQLATNAPESNPVVNVSVEAPTLPAVNVESDPELSKQQKKTNQLLEGLYEDSQGKVRQANGAFASRQQKEAFTKEKLASEKDDKDKSKFKVLSDWALKTAGNVDKNDAVDNAGVAVGSSFWMAGKEIVNITKDAKEFIDKSTLLNVEKRKEKTKVFTEKGTALFSSIKNKFIKDSDKGKDITASDNPAPSPRDKLKNYFVDRASQMTSGHNSSTSLLPSDPTSLVSTITNDAQTSTENNTRVATSSNSSNNSDRSDIAISTGNSASQIRNEANESNVLKASEEQTVTLVNANNKQIALLEDIKDAINATGSSGGLFGGNGLDLDLGRDRKGKRKKNRKGRSRSRERGRKPKGLLKRMTSVMSTGGEMAGSVASGVGSKVGSVTRGVGSKVGSVTSGAGKFAKMAGKGIGKFVPFLAPILAGVDAVQGFTDTDRQKDVFNLKDDQEASLGQKSSMALGNLLDMGGLVSGGAGLLGSGLGMLGLDGAKEALSFDTDSMTKGIYSFFGGSDSNTKNESNDTAKNSTVSLNAGDKNSVKNESNDTAKSSTVSLNSGDKNSVVNAPSDYVSQSSTNTSVTDTITPVSRLITDSLSMAATGNAEFLTPDGTAKPVTVKPNVDVSSKSINHSDSNSRVEHSNAGSVNQSDSTRERTEINNTGTHNSDVTNRNAATAVTDSIMSSNITDEQNVLNAPADYVSQSSANTSVNNTVMPVAKLISDTIGQTSDVSHIAATSNHQNSTKSQNVTTKTSTSDENNVLNAPANYVSQSSVNPVVDPSVAPVAAIVADSFSKAATGNAEFLTEEGTAKTSATVAGNVNSSTGDNSVERNDSAIVNRTVNESVQTIGNVSQSSAHSASTSENSAVNNNMAVPAVEQAVSESVQTTDYVSKSSINSAVESSSDRMGAIIADSFNKSATGNADALTEEGTAKPAGTVAENTTSNRQSNDSAVVNNNTTTAPTTASSRDSFITESVNNSALSVGQFDKTETKLLAESKAKTSSNFTEPAPVNPRASKDASHEQSREVIAKLDPKLTKVMGDLLKATKDKNGTSSSTTNNNKSTTNIISQNKSGDSGIPISPSNAQLQLIAIDAV